jgi:ketosteroid isomerase-like protein
MAAPAATSPQQTVDALFGAFDALDTDALEALFGAEPQGVDELSGGWRRGREDLRRYLASLSEAGLSDVRSTLSDEHVTEWGDTALVTLVLDQTYTVDEEEQSVHAPTSIVLRREAGAWRVVLVHSVPVGDEG